MKKLISVLLLIAMLLSLFAGCGEEEQPADTTAEVGTQSDLESAKAYLLSMYQTGKKDQPVELAANKDVLKSVVVAKTTYSVAWSVEVTSGAADSVTVGESLTANCVTLCIPESTKEDILFTATATISDPNGNTTTAEFNYKIVGYAAMEKLVEEAYALEAGQSMEEEVTIGGKIISVNTPYSEDFQNITVTIQVGDLADKPVKCYRLTGEGVDNLGVGDTISVYGILTNYNGNIQIIGEPSCKLMGVIKSTVPPPEAPEDPKQIVEEAYALEKDASLPYVATLTGIITTIDSPYAEQYQNVTVTMVVEGCETLPIKCYRMKGEGAELLAPGDTITVTGMIVNYNGTIEFGQGCKLDSYVEGEGAVIVAPEDPKQLVEEAYALSDGASLPYNATLTGVISSVDTPYDAGYQNITVTITIEGCEDKPIKCYRLKGTGVDTLAVGDTITVSGTIKNYGGTIEFDAGCTLDSLVKGENEAIVAPEDPTQIVDEGYALEDGAALPYNSSLTGVITTVDTPYDSAYGNITVTITIEGREDKPIKCYRLKGDGVDTLAVGDTITVSGIIKNYGGIIEFDTGCALNSVVKGEGQIPGGDAPVVQETDPAKIMEAAGKLAENEEMSYDVTLSGKVTVVEDAYNADYQNITVTIAVTGTRSLLKCYRMKGTGVDQLAVGDTITVTGRIKNYGGTVELVNGTMTQRTSGGGSVIVQETDPAKIMAAAGKLAENEEMSYDVTLSGKVTTVDDAYNAEFQNITATIAVSGTRSFLKCYRLKGDGVDQLAVGDTITVTGRIKNYYGELELVNCTMTQRTSGGGTAIKAETDPLKIVDAAYALSENQQLAYDASLSGKVASVDDAYSADYQNITVTIQVSGRESKPIKCYRMKGDGVDQIAVGDTITVNGRLKNYNGTVEFDMGCQLTKRISGGGSVIVQETDPAKIMAAAGKLAENEEMSYDVTLSGKVTTVDDAYNADYQNITVTIAVNGTGSSLKCYRLKGDGVDQVAAGDTITVTGRIKNYYGELELVNCTMTQRTSGGGAAVKVETDPGKIIDAAYALAENTELAYDAELTGKVTTINTGYDANYQNISVTIAVTGRESKPILCYRLKGAGVDKICAGDTITVKGRLKNYNGTVEFDAGCALIDLKSSGVVIPSDSKQIVDAAFALEKNASLPYTATLTGKITEIVTEYSDQYKNISVNIEVEGSNGMKIIECYRLKGEGAESLNVGDTITVTGVLTRYYKEATDEKPELDKIEFGAGCTLDKKG